MDGAPHRPSAEGPAMRTIDETRGPGGRPTTDAPPRGRAARAGFPTIPLPRESAQAAARTARPARAATAVPASASTGVAELLRGPARAAPGAAGGGGPERWGGPVPRAGGRMSLPAAVYLPAPDARAGEVVGVLPSKAARLPLPRALFRPSKGRPLVALPAGAPAEVG